MIKWLQIEGNLYICNACQSLWALFNGGEWIHTVGFVIHPPFTGLVFLSMQASQVVNGPRITWLVRRLHFKRSGMLDRFWTRSIIEATSWISLIGWFDFI